jgi:hypothetical protein
MGVDFSCTPSPEEQLLSVQYKLRRRCQQCNENGRDQDGLIVQVNSPHARPKLYWWPFVITNWMTDALALSEATGLIGTATGIGLWACLYLENS